MLELLDQISALAAMSAYVRTTPEPKVTGLTSWLVSNGGLRDPGYDVRTIIGGARCRPGLVNNKSGMDLDDAALNAWEAGYLGQTDERPTINDLLDAIDRDMRDGDVFSHEDADIVEELDALEDARNELDRLGILAATRHGQAKVCAALAAYL